MVYFLKKLPAFDHNRHYACVDWGENARLKLVPLSTCKQSASRISHNFHTIIQLNYRQIHLIHFTTSKVIRVL